MGSTIYDYFMILNFMEKNQQRLMNYFWDFVLWTDKRTGFWTRLNSHGTSASLSVQIKLCPLSPLTSKIHLAFYCLIVPTLILTALKEHSANMRKHENPLKQSLIYWLKKSVFSFMLILAKVLWSIPYLILLTLFFWFSQFHVHTTVNTITFKINYTYII